MSLLLVAGFLGNENPDAVAVSISNGNGTASGTGTVLGTPVPMSQTFNVELKGDYLAAGVGMRGTGPPGGGTITIPALPGGSTVQNAFLYWAVMEDGTPASLATGTLNGNNIVGSLIGSTGDPCWDPTTPPPDFDIHNYVADVTGLQITGGNNTLTNFASGGPPGTSASPPLLEGASLVVVYSNPASQNRRIQIHEGAITFVNPPKQTTTFSGWTAVAGTSRTTFIVADGQSGGAFNLNNRTLIDAVETANHTLNGAGPGTEYWDTLTQTITGFIPPTDTSVSVEVESTGNDCITWVAQVLSVPVAEPPTGGPVGGIVQIRTGADAPAEESDSSDGGYGTPILPLAIGGTAFALAVAGWRARERWLR